MVDSNNYYYKNHPANCQRYDYWGQVKRTLNGKAVNEEQIDLIVDSICDGISLQSQDRVLDLCCGNGALTHRVFARCSGGVGVDFSKFLINVAQSDFAKPPRETYVVSDVLTYMRSAAYLQFNKVVCYGAFMFFKDNEAIELLQLVRQRYPKVSAMFLGNLPDLDRIKNFSGNSSGKPGVEKRDDTAIGIWRSQAEIQFLAGKSGWNAKIRFMPKNFFASNYRFDVVLSIQSEKKDIQ